MSRRRRTLLRATAPLALMALIFWLSAQPDLNTGFGVWDTIGRKLVHAVAYGSLTALWWWSLRPTTRLAVPAAAAIALLYGISDEYHQSFVEGRSGSPVDVGFDLIGIACAWLLLRYDHRPGWRGRWRERGTMPGGRRPARGQDGRAASPGRPLRGRGD